MMNIIKGNLIDMMLGLCLIAFGLITALSLSDDFKINHSWIGSVLAPFVIFGCVIATTNFVILAIKLIVVLLDLYPDVESNNEDVSKAKCDKKRLKRLNKKGRLRNEW
ncbi:hypothetical protein N7550_22425 [Escherichia coli]|nr:MULTISPECIES: hypothetical protein [Enterobacteriaceae]EBM4505658.1 hypothetical protein [Salmonella enterica]ECE9085799.1 hypothetical protein [Salmonella enterica subsp. enterica serovar Corvallis]ECG4008779.1 hypothetical protein [Salmonella enterica subsp. enterica serovar Enteritidis]EEH6280884.1 iron-containing alcohol dehydrogenase [Salmonella enterica subsp. enterica serovar Stanley]HCM5085922.1 hypothetical protein [Klebsiella aerogenes]HCQ0109861.1 hypothetical protein [Citrobact